jgi:hypothetical protein
VYLNKSVWPYHFGDCPLITRVSVLQPSSRQTLLVKARWSISNATGVRVTKGMYVISLAFTQWM